MRGIDTYTLIARVLPALISLSPVLVWALPAAPSVPWRWWTAIASTGAVVLVAVIVRHVGRWREPTLLRHFGGDMPTTTALLLSEPSANTVTKIRRREALGALYGRPLPTAEQERADPQSAREVIDDAVLVLRGHVRAHPNASPLMAGENRTYGLLRNTWAIKPLGLPLAALVLLAALIAGSTQGWQSHHVASAVVAAAMCALWLVVFTPRFIHRAAQIYADRLLDALGHLPTTTS